MEFKKVVITDFAKKSLEAYVIDLDFKDELGNIKIRKLANLSQKFIDSKLYDEEPELMLLPRPGTSFKLGLGSLTFNDSITKDKLQIGNNFLKIIIEKYELSLIHI